MQKMTAVGSHNARQLYYDVFWYGVLAGGTLAFLPVYAARLGANGFQVALLTAGPAVVNLFVSLPAARWLEGRSLTWAVVVAAAAHRSGYLVFIVLPWLFSSAVEIWALIAVVVLMSVPGTVIAVAFNALFADLVTPEWRAQVVGRRNALIALSMLGTSLLCGWLLNNLVFPLNYQIVFGLGVLGAAMSTYYLARLRPLSEPPPRVGRPLNDMARPGTFRFADTLRPPPGLRFLVRAPGEGLLRLDLLRGPFGPFLLVLLLFYTFQFAPVPILPLFWVNHLVLSDGIISMGTAIFHGTMLLASMGLARLSSRWRHHQILAASAILYGGYPLLNALAPNAGLFLVASALGGSVWGVASGGLVTRLMERVPEGDRPAHMALHNLALNLGILGGSLLGPLLSGWLDLRAALAVSGGLRILAGLLLAVWG
jgi:MFS family permease